MTETGPQPWSFCDKADDWAQPQLQQGNVDNSNQGAGWSSADGKLLRGHSKVKGQDSVVRQQGNHTASIGDFPLNHRSRIPAPTGLCKGRGGDPRSAWSERSQGSLRFSQ